MTEPIDESAVDPEATAAPDASEPPPAASTELPPEAATEPTTEPAAGGGDQTDVPPVAPPASAWVAPDASRGAGRSRGCCLIVAVVTAAGAILLLFALIALIFLGSQVQSVLRGSIQFGTGGSGCSVTGLATSFPASAKIHSAAYLERDVRAGETLTLAVTAADGTSETTDQTFVTSGSCLYDDLPSGLPAGHYVLEYRSGTEVLSHGAFDITP